MMPNTSPKGPIDPFEAALNSPTGTWEDMNYECHEPEITGGKSNEEIKVHVEASSTDGGGPQSLPEREGSPRMHKGPWKPEEDAQLLDFINKYGPKRWHLVHVKTGLARSGKSCRLRWMDHLRPGLKKSAFTPEEQEKLIELHGKFGNRWSKIAKHMEGRTDNDVKNHWNTLSRRSQLAQQPIYPPQVFPTTTTSTEDNHNVIPNAEIQGLYLPYLSSFPSSSIELHPPQPCMGLASSYPQRLPLQETSTAANIVGSHDPTVIDLKTISSSGQHLYLPYLSSFPSSSIELHPPQSCMGIASSCPQRLPLQETSTAANIVGSHDPTVADLKTNSNSGQPVIPDGVQFSPPRPVNNIVRETCEIHAFQNPSPGPEEPARVLASSSVEQANFLPSPPNYDSMASILHQNPFEPCMVDLDSINWNTNAATSSDHDGCIYIGSLWSFSTDEDIF